MTYGNKVIATGYNSSKTSPLQKSYNKLRGFEMDTKNNGSIHAEMACLLQTRNLDIDWNKVSIYIYREKRISNNSKEVIPALAKPCPACAQAIIDRGIKNVYYSEEGKEFVYEKLR